MKKLTIYVICLLNLIIYLGCSTDPALIAEEDTSSARKKNTVQDAGAKDTEDTETLEVCETINADLMPIPSRLMILEDKSTSMDQNNKWNLAMDAIKSMITKFDGNIAFGLDLFSISDSDSENSGGFGMRRTSDMCAVGTSVAQDVALKNGYQVLGLLDNYSPGGGTPLLLAMKNFTNPMYAPTFLDGTSDSYLVIISDGADTCGADGQFQLNGGGASAMELAQQARYLDEVFGVKSVPIGLGEGAVPEQLDAIAQAGGTGLQKHFQVADGIQLANTLDTIAKKVVVSCLFEIEDLDSDEVDLDLVNIFIDEKPIPRDYDCKDGTGWTWNDKEQSVIRICKKACDKIDAESTDELQLEFACGEDQVYTT